jgi:hypothetical protein
VERRAFVRFAASLRGETTGGVARRADDDRDVVEAAGSRAGVVPRASRREMGETTFRRARHRGAAQCLHSRTASREAAERRRRAHGDFAAMFFFLF